MDIPAKLRRLLTRQQDLAAAKPEPEREPADFAPLTPPDWTDQAAIERRGWTAPPMHGQTDNRTR